MSSSSELFRVFALSVGEKDFVLRKRSESEGVVSPSLSVSLSESLVTVRSGVLSRGGLRSGNWLSGLLVGSSNREVSGLAGGLGGPAWVSNGLVEGLSCSTRVAK